MLRSEFLLWLLLSAATIFARSVPTVNTEKAREAAREQVWWQGRLCTLSTLADDFLQTVYGKSTYKGLSAVQVVYGWRLRPDVWKDEPMILVPDDDLRRRLGIEGEYARFSQLFDDTLGYRLTSLGADLPERLRQLYRESPPVVELDEKAGLIILLTEGRLIQPRPDSIPALSTLQIEAEVLYNNTPAWLILLAAALLAALALIAYRVCRSRASAPADSSPSASSCCRHRPSSPE